MFKILDNRFDCFIEKLPENFAIKYENEDLFFVWECCGKSVKVDHFKIIPRVLTVEELNIYYGDIFEVEEMLRNKDLTEWVKYTGFVFKDKNGFFTFGDSDNYFGVECLKTRKIKKIGNIFKNPELKEKIGTIV